MYYIWFDESDKEGAYYSNFYGGILVDSKNYENVLAMSKTFVEEFTSVRDNELYLKAL